MAFLLIFLFSGCAQTCISQNGKQIVCIQGDCTNVTVKWLGGTFHADTLNHSAATAAAYSGATSVVGAVGAGVVSGLLGKP